MNRNEGHPTHVTLCLIHFERAHGEIFRKVGTFSGPNTHVNTSN